MMRRLLMMILVVGFASSLSIPVANASGKKGITYSATASNDGNCTVTTTGIWSEHRILSVTFTLTVGGVPYTPATESLKRARRSGALSHTFRVTNAGTATVHADFTSPKKTVDGTADSVPITVSCT